MEKIREALAKARSDKAFRDHHPVADVGAYERPLRHESNDDAGTDPAADAGVSQPDTPLPKEGAPEERALLSPVYPEHASADLEREHHALTRDSVDRHAGGLVDRIEDGVPDADEGGGIQHFAAPTARAVSGTRRAKPVMDAQEVVDDEPAAGDSAPAVEAPEPVAAVLEKPRKVETAAAAEKSRPGRHGKWLVILLALLFLLVAVSVAVHLYWMPLDQAVTVIISPDTPAGEEVRALTGVVIHWVENVAQNVIDALQVPE